MKRKKQLAILFILMITVIGWVLRYTTLNLEYKTRFHFQTKTFTSGIRVPFEADYIDIDLQADGYWIEVHDFKIMDYNEYIQSASLTLGDDHTTPDKIALVYATLFNEDSTADGIMLTELQLHGYDVNAYIDWDVLTAANPGLMGNFGIQLTQGTKYDLILPFDLFKRHFSSHAWKHLDESNFFLRITSYPVAKDIQVQ